MTKLKRFNLLIICFSLFSTTFTGCNTKEVQKGVTVRNTADFERDQETVSIPADQLSQVMDGNEVKDILVQDDSTGEYLVSQWIDYDQDSVYDELLFQVDLSAGEQRQYLVVWKENGRALQPKSKTMTYSRFVPERTDDYTWENDKVAFRVYGPAGEKGALEGVPGSTLSSGIDVWLKRTDQPVINKWYSEHLKSPGYYHIDHGEGYDPYHVGASRGTGGIGVWENDSLHVSRNYTAYKTIATGPLRTVFDLTYAPWSPYDLQEKKRISLDLGANFSKIEVSLESDEEVPNVAVGITLHKNEGEIRINEEKGWVRHWELIDSAFVGEGIVIEPSVVDTAFARQTNVPDQSHLLVLTKPKDQLTYYAGFAWEKSGQVSTAEDWDAMLDRQAEKISNPLEISVEN